MSAAITRLIGSFCHSGYGAANKELAATLIKAGFDISIKIITTPHSRPEFAYDESIKKILPYVNNKTSNINLAQLVPVLWKYGFEKNKYNIGYFFWESTSLSSQWKSLINDDLCSEVWVPCPSNKQALLNSGITKPIHVIPQITTTKQLIKTQAQQILPIPIDNIYKFYSIFQWSERKNGKALVEAYCKEFSKKDNILLVLKTYGPSAFSDRRWIKELICDIKEKSGSNAPIYLIDQLLTPQQVDAIAPQCDCYVTTTRGEGWHLGLVAGMQYKQQIITPKTGGMADWLSDDTAYIIPHTLIDIDTSKQAWGDFYISKPSQKWGDVKVEDVQRLMRQAYNERNDFSHRVARYDDILKVCNEENVVKLIKERLNKIIEEII